MTKKELVVRTTILSKEGSDRAEHNWDEITDTEKEIIRRILTDRFMGEAGYYRADQKAT